MKNLSKIALLVLITAVSFEACTKSNNTAPKATATTTNKMNSSTALVKRDTITPIKSIAPLIKRDTITPIID